MNIILNAYSLDTEHIDLTRKKLYKLPDLTRFTKLKKLLSQFLQYIMDKSLIS